MNFAARPAWRYQWRALLFVPGVAAGALAVIAQEPIPRLGRTGHVAVASGLAALAALVALVAVYRRYRYDYRIEDRVIEARKGILARKVDALHLDDLRHVEVNQGVWQRILGVGTIRFASAGTDQPEIVFRGVMHPDRIRQKLQQHVETSPGPPASGPEVSPAGPRSPQDDERRFCTHCGERLKASANFCSQCGQEV